MKKLEKMDGKLFESLKPNEMSNLASFVGGRDTQATDNGKDFFYVYQTWELANGQPVNIREDSRSATYYYEGYTLPDPEIDYDGYTYTEINNEPPV